MMVRAVVPPTVPEGTQRVRVCLHAGNDTEEIKRLVDAMEAWALSQHSKPSVVETTTKRDKMSVSARL